MGKTIIKLGKIEIKKKFISIESSVSIKKIDIDKIVVSNKIFLGKMGLV